MQKQKTTQKKNNVGILLPTLQQDLLTNNINNLSNMWISCRSKAINNLNLVVVGGLLKQVKQGGLFNDLNNITIKTVNTTIKNNSRNYNFTTILFVENNKISYSLQLHHNKLLNNNEDYMLFNSDNKLVFKTMLRRELIKFINTKQA